MHSVTLPHPNTRSSSLGLLFFLPKVSQSSAPARLGVSAFAGPSSSWPPTARLRTAPGPDHLPSVRRPPDPHRSSGVAPGFPMERFGLSLHRLGEIATIGTLLHDLWAASGQAAPTFVVTDCPVRCLRVASPHIPLGFSFSDALAAACAATGASGSTGFEGQVRRPLFRGHSWDPVRRFPGHARFPLSLHPPLRDLCWLRPRSRLLFRFRLPPPKRQRQPLCSSTRS